MMIPKDVSVSNMDYVNLLPNNGGVNLNMIIYFEETYIRKEWMAKQDTNVLYLCLIKTFKIQES